MARLVVVQRSLSIPNLAAAIVTRPWSALLLIMTLTGCDSQSKPPQAGQVPNGTEDVGSSLDAELNTSRADTAPAADLKPNTRHTALPKSAQADPAQAELQSRELGKGAPDFTLMDIAGL